jgi:hypothetical protein
MGNIRKSLAVIALIAYFWLATPTQAILWYLSPPRVRHVGWPLLLNCGGAYLEATAILVAMAAVNRACFALGGSAPSSQGAAGGRRLFVVAGIVAALMTSLTWWYVLRFVSNYLDQRDYILGLHYVARHLELQADVGYYRLFSIFVAIYLGILAGEVTWRWSLERRLLPYPPPRAKHSDSDFVWTSWVAWLALYRLFTESIHLLLTVAFSDHNVGPLDSWPISLLPLVGTSIACVFVSLWLFGHTPRTRQSSISGTMAASLLIPVIATPLLITTGFGALGPLALCIVTLNIGGFVWGWIVGDLRWRSLQLQKSAQTTN